MNHLISAGKGHETQHRIETDFVKKKGQNRRSYSSTQIYELEHVFNKTPFIDCNVKVELAEKLNLTENQILIWFKNRRSKKGITKQTWKNNQVNRLTNRYN